MKKSLFVVLGLLTALLSVRVVVANECYRYAVDPALCDEATILQTPPFVAAEPPDDTLFGRRWYARLDDFTNVYAQPNYNAGIIRNIGDGYIFATVQRRVTNDAGEEWLEINHGEFVAAENATTAQPSPFQGVELIRQPTRPFAWVVQEIRPSSAPDGEPNPDFVTLERYDMVEIYDAVVGEEEWIWYDIGEGRWVRQTQFSVVDVTERPDEVGADEAWVEVDLYEQTFTAYEGDRMVYATLISSGLNRWPTTEGVFQVSDRLREYKMSGAEGKVDYYFIDDIPFIMYFEMSKGIALHGTFWHDRFGYKHSHGCVNMSIKDAEWAWNWSGDADNDLWVYVHTSDSQDYLK